MSIDTSKAISGGAAISVTITNSTVIARCSHGTDARG